MSTSPAPTPTTTDHQPAPYGNGADTPTTAPRVVRTHHLQTWKTEGHKWAMLTAYDHMTAGIFDAAGIPALLVGDSAANNVLGYPTTLGVTVDEMLMITRAVTRGTHRALVIADLPFGSYQNSPQQAYATATRFMKEGGAHAVKIEGGTHMAGTIAHLTAGGIPVLAHVGFTPQSEHALGGYRVQGRGAGAEQVIADAHAVADAGAFAVVMEMVPSPVAEEITRTLAIPTVGIGAGPACDAQVLVWQDMLGLRDGKMPRFVKQYAQLRATFIDAVQQYATDVATGQFPAAEHSFAE